MLNSSSYDSLNPGYYVTFTGVYTTQEQAQIGPAACPEQGLLHGLRSPRGRLAFGADFVTLVRGMLDCRVGAVRGALLTRC